MSKIASPSVPPPPGLSDPYCRLGILPREHENSRAVQQKRLMDWQKERLVGEIASTTVKPATLEPTWNEDFEL